MKLRVLLSCVFALLAFALTAIVPAAAQLVYENGPINGNEDAWTINFGYIVSDTFTLVNPSTTITGFSFGAWLFPGDVLTSAEIFITSQEFGGTTYFDQVVNFTQSGCTLNTFGFDVCEESSTFHGPTLNAGTYWLNLENASVPNGDPVYWDENAGVGCHSQGCPSQPSENSLGTILSEAFSMYGGTNTGSGSTPEPGGLLLFGSGVLAAAAVIRRRFL